MPNMETVHLTLGDLALIEAGGAHVRPAELGGVQLVVLMRHRH